MNILKFVESLTDSEKNELILHLSNDISTRYHLITDYVDNVWDARARRILLEISKEGKVIYLEQLTRKMLKKRLGVGKTTLIHIEEDIYDMIGITLKNY